MWFVQGILKLLKNENSMEELGRGRQDFQLTRLLGHLGIPP